MPACYNVVFGQFKDILIRLAVKMVSWKSAMMVADMVRATVIVVVRGGGDTADRLILPPLAVHCSSVSTVFTFAFIYFTDISVVK